MREIARLIRITSLFLRLWERYPDMRFFQLVKYIEKELPEDKVRHDSLYQRPVGEELTDKYPYVDSFDTEDDVLEMTLHRLVHA